MTALEPTPTPLDERVLDALPRGRPGIRGRAVADRVAGRHVYGQGRIATPERVAEVRRILRGFEHLGRVRQAGGWWSR